MPRRQPPPVYDPATHIDPNETVHVQLFCTCGGVWRQIDPVSIVEPYVRQWLARHPVEDGHGAATIAEAIDERESRKQAAMRAGGKGGEYQRKTYETLDDTCTAARPWPVFPEKQEG